jgi:uncharacterized phage protein (TIGR02218 family)
MLTLPGAGIAHLAQENRRLTVCGIVTKTDGSIVRCTQFDDDLEITSGPFEGVYFSTAAVSASNVVAKSDMSVDNLEVDGIFKQSSPDDFGFTGFTIQDIQNGNFRNAAFTLFICQWDNPTLWQKVIQTGTLGQIVRTAEGTFTAEWRGIMQALQQNIGRVYSELCDVKNFCDPRCGLNINDFSYVATVTAAVDRRIFSVSLGGVMGSPSPVGADFDLGKITFGSEVRQIKRGDIGDTAGSMEVWEPFLFDLTPGLVGVIVMGCDRRFVTCQKFHNAVNFRGHGFWIPGMPKIIRAPPA